MSDEFTEDMDAPEMRQLEWDGERIDFGEALRDRGIIYARKTITDRALPDVRDGLKPVHRRIIFAMFEMGLKPTAKPKKSSKIVGDTMGAYHPHGDTSIYGAMGLLAQDFKLTQPLIRGYGEWGSPDSNPAAPRYTEATLSAAGWTMATDLNEQIVRYVPTYDEENREPTVLPMPFPNLLVNGTSGMAYGMACDYPTHNMAEAIDAALLVADDENVSLKKILKKMPGPDFPGGGIVVNPENLPGIYEKGQGTVKLQAKFHVEGASSSQPKIVITELPYQSGYKKLVKEIKEANAKTKVFEELLPDSEALNNYSSDETGMHIEIACRRGADVNQLLQELLKLSTFQRTIKFNFNAIVEREGVIRPQHLSLMQILQEFVQFRRVVITRRLELERRDHLKRIHELDGVIAALDMIDEVIRIIRSSKNTDIAREKLMKAVKYKLDGARKSQFIDEDQARYILNIRLAKLTQLDQFELRAERDQRRARVVEINAILDDPVQLNTMIKSELAAMRDQFGRPRSTLLQTIDTSASLDEIAAASQRPAEDVTVFVTRAGSVLVQPHRGRRQSVNAPIKMTGSDQLVAVIDTMSDADLIAVTSSGDAHLLLISDAELQTTKGSGDALVNLRGEKIAGVYQEQPDQDFLVMVTRDGKLKRIHRETLAQVSPEGVPAYRVDDDDEIVAVLQHAAGSELMIATAQGQLLRTALDKLRPTKGGAAGGRDAIKLREGDTVIGAQIARGHGLLTVHATGMGKRVKLDEYPVKGVATGGVQSASCDKPTRQPAGLVTGVHILPAKGELQIITSRGAYHTLKLSALDPVARAVVSRPLIELAEGESIVRISTEG